MLYSNITTTKIIMSTGLPQGKKKSSRRGTQVKIELQGEYDVLGCDKISQDIMKGTTIISHTASERSQPFSRNAFGIDGPTAPGFGQRDEPRKTVLSKPREEEAMRPREDFTNLSFGTMIQQPEHPQRELRRDCFGSAAQTHKEHFGSEQLSRENFGTQSVADKSFHGFGSEVQADFSLAALRTSEAPELTRQGFGTENKFRRESSYFPNVNIADISRDNFGQEKQAEASTEESRFHSQTNPSRRFFARSFESCADGEKSDACDLRESLFGKSLHIPIVKSRKKPAFEVLRQKSE